MSISPFHWLFAALVAVSAHLAAFTGFELDDSAKIERAAGVHIAVGSLSSYASQADVQETSANEEVEAADSDVVEEENPGQVDADSEKTVQSAVKPVVQTAEQVPEKLPEQSQVTIPVANPTTEPEDVTPEKTIKAVGEEEKVVPVVKKPPVKKAAAKKKKRKTAKRKTKSGKRTAAARRGTGGGGRQSSVSGSAAFSNYKGRVRARVASRVRKPVGLKGQVVVRFSIVRSGRVTGAHIIKSTNIKLNRRVVAAVRGSFQAIPPGLPGRITFTIPINFR